MNLKQLTTFLFLLLITIFSFIQSAEAQTTTSQRNFEFRSVSELGFVGVLGHKIQFSNRLESQVFLADDLVVDDLTYPASTSVNLLYNFPFYRISYLRELLPNKDKYSLGIGASIQVRNATITFESTDGTLFRTNRDLGVVPILKTRFKAQLSDWVYTEFEADGFYAPISYLNGDTNDVIGAILDFR